MDDLALEQLLADLESDRVERTESVHKDKRAIEEAICAFANDLPNHLAPGVVFIGEKDKGGHSGLPITDELLLSLSGIRSDGNILPLPRMDVQKRTLRGHDYAVIIVHPSDDTPIRPSVPEPLIRRKRIFATSVAIATSPSICSRCTRPN